MKTCLKCKSKIKDGIKFCPMCGSKVEEIEETIKPVETEETNKIEKTSESSVNKVEETNKISETDDKNKIEKTYENDEKNEIEATEVQKNYETEETDEISEIEETYETVETDDTNEIEETDETAENIESDNQQKEFIESNSDQSNEEVFPKEEKINYEKEEKAGNNLLNFKDKFKNNEWKDVVQEKIEYIRNHKNNILSDKKNKIIIGLLVVVIISIADIIHVNNSKTEAETVANREIESYKSDNESLKSDVEELNSQIQEQEVQIKELNEKVKEAKPWFDMKEEERKKKEAEEEKKRKEKEAEEEKKRKEKEAQEQKEREEKEKNKYETGVTYDQLARNPNSYIGELVKFSGKIIQVVEGGSESEYRMAVGGNYDNILYLSVPKSLIVNNRILEGDYITVYGESDGTITYESSANITITIPAVMVEKISR